MALTKSNVAALIASMAMASCGTRSEVSAIKYRNLSQAEAIQDFHDITNSIQAYYGPLKYKEARFGYKVADLAREHEAMLASAKTDDEVFGVYKKFLASLHDGHVSLAIPRHANPVMRYRIPIFVTPVEGKAIVANVEASVKDLGIEVGDELVSVDGKTTDEITKIAQKYDSFATEESNAHFVGRATSRNAYITELAPTAAEAKLEIKKADGTTSIVKALWRLEKISEKSVSFAGDRHHGGLFVEKSTDLNSGAEGSLLAMGATDPFFFTPKSKAKFNMTRLTPSEEFRTKYNLAAGVNPNIFAAMYKYSGKTILLVREPTYAPSDVKWQEYIKYYSAVLDQFEQFADVLVIDQNHNPGGDSDFVESFFRLFINEAKPTIVEAVHADRKWINEIDQAALELDPTLTSETSRQAYRAARQIEAAYDAGEWLSSNYIPFGGAEIVKPQENYTWKKPILVLADELSGSCGDIFPMLIKRNGVGKLFGKRTMGLGGNVEVVATLTNSQASLRLTRGLFTTYRPDGNYDQKELVENNGIVPDIAYEHTVKDFRAGFVGYVDAFSKAAIDQIKP